MVAIRGDGPHFGFAGHLDVVRPVKAGAAIRLRRKSSTA
jgi:hypothetical protein